MSTHGSPPIQRPAAVVVASSSVAQVRTRIACSLSSAARTVLWCVSGTLRIHPRCGWRGAAATSAASQARASRNVSLSVSMMSDAGIDSGIGATREMIAYRTRNRRMKGLLMLRAVATSIALVLVLAGAAGAAGPELKTDEQKTLYALGLEIARNLASFYLTAADLKVVAAGIADGLLKTEPKADLETWGPKIQVLATARAAIAAVAEKKASQAFLDKAAGEQGAVKTASGLIVTTLKPGDGASPAATDRVKVHYHGTLTDGTVFDSSVKRGEPLTIALGGGVIKCWSEGVPLMKVGGKSRLVCPSDLAYGDQGRPPTIKPGATLVFEVDLLEIVK